MKLHLHTSPLNLVTQYGDGYLDVNQTRYTENVLITPEHVAPWGRAGFDGRPHAAHVAADYGGHIGAADRNAFDDFHVGCFGHGVSRFDQRDQPLGFD